MPAPSLRRPLLPHLPFNQLIRSRMLRPRSRAVFTCVMNVTRPYYPELCPNNAIAQFYNIVNSPRMPYKYIGRAL
jgi:hypothetical protein